MVTVTPPMNTDDGSAHEHSSLFVFLSLSSVRIEEERQYYQLFGGINIQRGANLKKSGETFSPQGYVLSELLFFSV